MAQNQQVMKASKVNLDNINLSEPRKFGDKGVQIVFVNYGTDNSSLYIQTPKANVVWDSKYFADNDDSGKYSIVISMSNMGSDAQMASFHNKMTELDEYLIDAAYENRAAWFSRGAKLSRETIETLYTPMIKVSVDSETGEPNGKFPPSFKLKVKKKDGKHECSIYDVDKKSYNVDDKNDPDFVDLESVITKGSTMNVILKCNGIWLINNKFGCTWNAEQIMVTTRPTKALNGCAFIDDEDDEDTAQDTVSEKVVNEMVQNVVDDSESDSDDEEESEPVPVPAPAQATPKKKRVVKKKA